MNIIGKILFSITLMISDLQGHGFGKDTIILSCQNDVFCLEHMFTKGYRPHHIVTFDNKKREHPHKKIAAIQPGTTNCYIRISVNNEPSHDIICTPSQEFYLPDQDTWAEACTLKVGDHLLGKVFTHIPITDITFHAEPCDIYLIEVEDPHTFFVGVYSVLTKNMILPCVSVGYVFPLGCGTGSGLLSTLLGGTLTGSIGFIIGGVAIGYVIKRCMTNTDPKHDFVFDIPQIGCVFNTKDKTKEPDNASDAQAPGVPTENDGFEPAKNWDGKKVKSPNGRGYGWPDKKGNIWIPSGPKGHGGPHWDVQYPDGDYDNVVPGGRIRGKK